MRRVTFRVTGLSRDRLDQRAHASARTTAMAVAYFGAITGLAAYVHTGSRHLETSPDAVAFGRIPSTTSGPPQSLAVINSTGAPLTLAPLRLQSDTRDVFVVQKDRCSSETLLPGAHCLLSLSFEPGNAGPFSATLTVSDTTSSYSAIATLSGEGTATPGSTSLRATPPALSFVGTPATAPLFHSLVLTNSGSRPIDSLTVHIQSTTLSRFVVSDNKCANRVLAPASTCQLSLGYRPQAGTQHGALVIEGATLAAPLVIPLTGSGTIAPPTVHAVLAPVTVDFGQVTVGSVAGYRDITIRVQGTRPLRITSISPSADVSAFAINYGNCWSDGGPSKEVYLNCTVKVDYRPTHAGPAHLALEVHSNASPPLPRVTLAGVGLEIPPVRELSVIVPNAALGFWRIADSSRAEQTVTVTYTGNTPLSNMITSIGGAGASAFRVGSANNTCRSTLQAPADSCHFQLQFRPSKAGEYRATLGSRGDVAFSPTVALSAVAYDHLLTLTPAGAMHFSVDPASGTLTGTQRLITITNVSPLTVTLSSLTQRAAAANAVLDALSIQVAGSPSERIFNVNDECSGVTLQPGGSCRVVVMPNVGPQSRYATFSIGNSIDSERVGVRVELEVATPAGVPATAPPVG